MGIHLQKDGDTETFYIDAKNTGLPVGFNVVKKGTDGPLLAGAEFTLYSNEACTTVAKDLNNKSVFTSASDGKTNIQFRLSPNAQTYYLKETKAPTGYICCFSGCKETTKNQNNFLKKDVRHNKVGKLPIFWVNDAILGE